MSPVQAVGKFYDGQSGSSHEVMVGLSGSSLRIISVDGSFEKNWSFNEVQVLEDANAPQPAKLTSSREPDARLLINADTGWLRIKDRLPQAAFPRITLPVSSKSFIGYAGLAIAVLIAIFVGGPKLLEEGYRFVPQSTEDALGRYAVKRFTSAPVCQAEAGQEALKALTERLQNATQREIDYTIYVIENDEMLNALAAPGGHLILFSAVIDKADSPEEVAGVLAHEMAHVELYHPTRGLLRDTGFGVLLSMMTGSADMVRLAGNLHTLRYSRDDEQQADVTGQEILKRANINPGSMSLFFERMLKEQQERKKEDDEGEQSDGEAETTTEKSSHKWLTYFSTHPATEERIAAIKDAAPKSGNFKAALSKQEWRNLKEICTQTEEN